MVGILCSDLKCINNMTHPRLHCHKLPKVIMNLHTVAVNDNDCDSRVIKHNCNQ